MTIMIASADDLHISLKGDIAHIQRAISWQLNASALTVLSASEISQVSRPSIGILMDGNEYRASIVFVGVEHDGVTLVMIRFAILGNDDVTEYHIQLLPNEETGWQVSGTVIIDTYDDETRFGWRSLHNQLGFFAS